MSYNLQQGNPGPESWSVSLFAQTLDDWPAHQRNVCTLGASGLPMAEGHCSAKLCPCQSTHAAGLAGQKKMISQVMCHADLI